MTKQEKKWHYMNEDDDMCWLKWQPFWTATPVKELFTACHRPASSALLTTDNKKDVTCMQCIRNLNRDSWPEEIE